MQQSAAANRRRREAELRPARVAKTTRAGSRGRRGLRWVVVGCCPEAERCRELPPLCTYVKKYVASLSGTGRINLVPRVWQFSHCVTLFIGPPCYWYVIIINQQYNKWKITELETLDDGRSFPWSLSLMVSRNFPSCEITKSPDLNITRN